MNAERAFYWLGVSVGLASGFTFVAMVFALAVDTAWHRFKRLHDLARTQHAVDYFERMERAVDDETKNAAADRP